MTPIANSITAQATVLLQQGVSNVYHFPLMTTSIAAMQCRIPDVCFQIDGNLVMHPEDYGITGHKMVSTAMSNMRGLKADWKWTQNAGVLQLEVIGGNVASKILDTTCMMQACSLLGFKEILLAIPNTNTLLVTGFEGKHEVPDYFVQQVFESYHQLAYQQICDLVFVYSDGELTDIVDLRPLSKRELKLAKGSDLDLDAHQQFSFKEVKVFTGNYYYSAEIGSQNEQGLFDLCSRAIQYLIKNGRDRADFIGVIEFTTLEAVNPYSTALNDRLNSFAKVLEASISLREEVKITNRSMEICFRFGGDEKDHKLPRKLIRIGL